MCNLYSARPLSALCPRPPTTGPATSRPSPEFSQTSSRRSCATASMVSANWSWRAGHAGTAAIWWPAGNQYSQRDKPALARLASATHRCLVLATSFCGYADMKPRKTPTWFALTEDRPLFAFGIVDPLAGRARAEERACGGRDEPFGFWTTEANAIVAPIHCCQHTKCSIVSVCIDFGLVVSAID